MRGDVHGDVFYESLEVIAARREVGLAVDFDEDAESFRPCEYSGRPCLRRQRGRISSGLKRDPSFAGSRWPAPYRPSASVSAFLQSIIPAPVFSRSSLTCCAEISMNPYSLTHKWPPRTHTRPGGRFPSDCVLHYRGFVRWLDGTFSSAARCASRASSRDGSSPFIAFSIVAFVLRSHLLRTQASLAIP